MTYARREEIVVATKVSGKMHDGPGGSGLSRVAIMEQVDASLRRLDTDYIDLYMIHRFDPDTPVEETMKALHDVAPRSFRLPTKETLLGWRDLTRPFDPGPRSAICPASTTVQASLRGCSRRLTPH